MFNTLKGEKEMSKTVVLKNASSPSPCKEEAKPNKRTKLRNFLKKCLPKKKKIRGNGRVFNSGGWSEEEIHEMVRVICKKCPGLTSINVYRNELTFSFECSPQDFLGKKKENKPLPNPSKRKPKPGSLDDSCAKCTSP